VQVGRIGVAMDETGSIAGLTLRGAQVKCARQLIEQPAAIVSVDRFFTFPHSQGMSVARLPDVVVNSSTHGVFWTMIYEQ